MFIRKYYKKRLGTNIRDGKFSKIAKNLDKCLVYDRVGLYFLRLYVVLLLLYCFKKIDTYYFIKSGYVFTNNICNRFKTSIVVVGSFISLNFSNNLIKYLLYITKKQNIKNRLFYDCNKTLLYTFELDFLSCFCLSGLSRFNVLCLSKYLYFGFFFKFVN